MFKSLKKFDIRNATTYVDLPELGAHARILVAPATEANPAYFNAMLALSGKRVRQLARTDKITAEDAALNREDDRQLFPKFVIRGWEGVEADGEPGTEGVDANGHVVFTRNAAVELCRVLPAHMMDRLRNAASTPERFYGDDEIAPPVAGELAGNSGGDSASS